MRVVLALESAVERTRLGAILPKAGHTVELVCDASGLLRALRGFKPEVAIVDWDLPGGSKGGLLRIVRAIRSERRVYYIVAGAPDATKDVTLAFEAGADDFIRRPLVKEEILARVLGPERINALSRLSRNEVATRDFTVPFDVTKLRSWQTVEQNLTSELGEMFGVGLTAVAGPRPRTIVHAAELPLSLPSEQIEVVVAIGLSGPDGCALAKSTLGSETPASCLEVVKEAANIAAGAFKRAAAAEGPMFTTGLPQASQLYARAPSGALVKEWAAKDAHGVIVHFMLVARPVEPKRVATTALREGMVICRDVNTASGMLIAAAGTRLTQTAVARMQDLVAKGMLIEISEPARSSQ